MVWQPNINGFLNYSALFCYYQNNLLLRNDVRLATNPEQGYNFSYSILFLLG
jgi:hypothetical protein